MFSKLSSVTNPFPQSARDAMSLAEADRSVFYDSLPSCGSSSFEPCLHHFSLQRDEVAPLNKMSNDGCCSPDCPPSNILGTTIREVSPGAPAGDHHRHVSSGGHKKNSRAIRNIPKNENSPRGPPLTKSNVRNDIGTPTSTVISTTPPGSGTKRGNGRSAPSSAENTQRNKVQAAMKPRTSSANAGEDLGTSPSRRRHVSPCINKNNTQQRSRSPSGKGRRTSGKGNLSSPSSSAKNNLSSRKSSGGRIRTGEGELSGPTENGVKALSSSEITVARRSARDTQRQMRQKAKLAIVMWKERMTKKREPSAGTNFQGCFPPVSTITLCQNEEQRSLSATRRDEESISRSPSPLQNRARQVNGRLDGQMYTPPDTRHSSPRKRENPSQQLLVGSPQRKSKSNSATNNTSEISPMRSATAFSEKDTQEFLDMQKEESCEIMESPIPRSSPDDLSATDASTKAASSSQHSAQQLQISCGVKRNSASSRENQRSKIPRPVDGPGEKVKKNDSAETTSVLHSSSSSEKDGTSQENLLALLPTDEKPCEPPPPPPATPASPPVGNKSVQSIPSRSNAPDFEEPQRCSQQLIRAVVEPMRDKRRRRGGQRMLHSTDDDEDEWPDSPSTLGSPPIMANRIKPRARHHARRSPKPVLSSSPLPLMMGKRSSGGDADGDLVDGTDLLSPSCVVSGPDSDTQSSAVIMPRRKPYLHRKTLEIKLSGASNEIVDNTIRKRQRQEIYMLNQVMTALEFAQFEHFCRTRNIPLSV